jgi:hypothetical protein
MTRALDASVRQRFPSASTRGLKSYAITRSLQVRRLRMPRARVRPGDPI